MVSEADKKANQKKLSKLELVWLYRKESIPSLAILFIFFSALSLFLGWFQAFNFQLDDPWDWFSRSGSIGCMLGALGELLLFKHTAYSNDVEKITDSKDLLITLRNKFQVLEAKVEALLLGQPYDGSVNITLPAHHQVVYSENMDNLRGVIPKINRAISASGIICIAVSSFIWGYGDLIYKSVN
ncbi:hypothetical protein ACJJIF_01310 [Microbulbifer sp. SSSA002]|uniref:hypothetical protein n=1 Tax=Microbulbifer sp. SSSA002 TaxID=3243376 RepID=UPI00403A3D6B